MNDRDASTWVQSLLPAQDEINHVNNGSSDVPSSNESDIRSILSPVKPVNLLPQVPINSNSYRKLSENEEHDCEIIGELMSFMLTFG